MQDTVSILIIQDVTYTFLVKMFLVSRSICICIDINLSKTVADDLLQYEKNWKMVFIEID